MNNFIRNKNIFIRNQPTKSVHDFLWNKTATYSTNLYIFTTRLNANPQILQQYNNVNYFIDFDIVFFLLCGNSIYFVDFVCANLKENQKNDLSTFHKSVYSCNCVALLIKCYFLFWLTRPDQCLCNSTWTFTEKWWIDARAIFCLHDRNKKKKKPKSDNDNTMT